MVTGVRIPVLQQGRGTMDIAMDNQDPRPIQSWHQALVDGILSKEQLAVLENMVTEGEAESISAAASMLDWQDTIINKPEHLYGF